MFLVLNIPKNDFRSLAHQQEARIGATVDEINLMTTSTEERINKLNQSKESNATTASSGVQTGQVPSRTWIVQAGQDWNDLDAQGSREFEISPELWKELLETR